MNRIAMVLVIFSVLPMSVFARGGTICLYASDGMKPIDAIVWTFANPHECGMDFSTYNRRISNYVKELKEEELEKRLIKSLLQKHVDELVNELRNGKVSYGVIESEEYINSIRYYRKLGFECKFDDFVLRKFLQNKYLQRCAEILSEFRNMKVNSYADGFAKLASDYIRREGRVGRVDYYKSRYKMHTESLMTEMKWIMEKSGLTFYDLGTSKEELDGFKEPPFFWKVRWFVGA